MVELFISVTLDSAGRFLVLMHLPEENQRNTIPLGTQCPSHLALGNIIDPRSLPSCGARLHHNTIPPRINRQPLLQYRHGGLRSLSH